VITGITLTNTTPLSADEVASVVEHMNDDHSDAILLYISAFTDLKTDNVEDAIMTNIDFSGIDIQLKLNRELIEQRILFADTGTKVEFNDRNNIRAVLVDMVKIARNSNRELTSRN